MHLTLNIFTHSQCTIANTLSSITRYSHNSTYNVNRIQQSEVIYDVQCCRTGDWNITNIRDGRNNFMSHLTPNVGTLTKEQHIVCGINLKLHLATMLGLVLYIKQHGNTDVRSTTQFVFTLHSRNTVNSCTRTVLKFRNTCKCFVPICCITHTERTKHTPWTVRVNAQWRLLYTNSGRLARKRAKMNKEIMQL